ncbi:hypothetical protein EQM14_05635 [Caproiciproducens sp. NJN-50]|uniref:hypothetical protein n=1 Tax=Acutalibacteraceae TaxID=3082771 RepID=UPI000FFE0FA8|nr:MULTISPECIES: hypothetical protein [Acutalibacteraceae]QAT49301.1 hypothetical protein EQM14_05635 [Caproiciproducens sp. NJN-50]
MKAHIPAAAYLTRRQKQIVREYDSNTQNENFTRYIKLSAVVLHTKFGFGHDRVADFLGAISAAAEAAEKDEIFWKHIDDAVIDEMKMPFDRENYEKVDK